MCIYIYTYSIQNIVVSGELFNVFFTILILITQNNASRIHDKRLRKARKSTRQGKRGQVQMKIYQFLCVCKKQQILPQTMSVSQGLRVWCVCFGFALRDKWESVSAEKWVASQLALGPRGLIPRIEGFWQDTGLLVS